MKQHCPKCGRKHDLTLACKVMNGYVQLTRQRRLTKEEAAKYNRIREQVAKDLPDLIRQAQQRKNVTDNEHTQ